MKTVIWVNSTTDESPVLSSQLSPGTPIGTILGNCKHIIVGGGENNIWALLSPSNSLRLYHRTFEALLSDIEVKCKETCTFETELEATKWLHNI